MIFKLLNLWPPFVIAGIRITKYRPEIKKVEVQMSLRLWNQNHERSHFGGSLYSMTDPFYALLIQENLSSGHEVWVKSAQIRFKRPGRGKVHAEFQLSDEKLEGIKKQLNEHSRAESEFEIKVLNQSKEVVAEVSQIVHVKKKRKP